MSRLTNPKRTQGKPRPRRPRRVLTAAVFLAAAASAAYFGYRYFIDRPRRTYEAHAEARRFLDLMDPDGAQAALRPLISEGRANAETQFLLARTSRMLEDYPAAQAHLGQAEALGWPPLEIDFEHLLIRVQEVGALDSVTQALQPYLERQSPEAMRILQSLAMGAYRNSRLALAKRWLDYWIELAPDDWRPRYLRGVLNYNIGYHFLAQEDFALALAINPHKLEARLWLGRSLLAIGRDYDEARRQFERYLEARPEDHFGLDGLARAHRALNQPEAARATLDRLFRLDRDHPGGLLTLAQLENDSDRPREALALVRRASIRTTDLQDQFTLKRLATDLCSVLGMEKEAKAQAEELQRMNADLEELNTAKNRAAKGAEDPDLLRRIGLLHLRFHQYQEALKWLDPALRRNPDDVELKQAVAHCRAGLAGQEKR